MIAPRKRLLKRMLLIMAPLGLCLLLTVKLSAQKVDYWGDAEGLLQDQASLIFETAYKVLADHPPAPVVSNERMLALLSLDALLHDTRLDNGKAFASYMNNIASNLLSELQKTELSGNEMRIFRFYNHGFVIKTPTVTIGIDLVNHVGTAEPFASDALMRQVVEQCDILFISHIHGDHADSSVAQMFYDQGKDVIVPQEMWKDEPLQLRILRGADVTRELIHLPTKGISLTVDIYPELQGETANNVYVITLPEGQTVMHTGDMHYTFSAKMRLRGNVKVDVLLVNSWMVKVKNFISDIAPALVISGHENEVNHEIDHREAYWLTFKRLSGIKPPFVVMAWGESILVNGRPSN